MTEDQSNEQAVIEFLSNELAVLPEKINIHTRLRQDLKLDGEDAADVIESFSLTFDIDIYKFRINDYFGPDAGIHPALSLVLSVFGNSKVLKTLRVSDLVRAVDAGRLG